MTKVTTPLISPPPVAKQFHLALRAERAGKVDAAAYGKHLAKTTAPENTPARFAELAFAKKMIEEAMKSLKPEVIRQVRLGNTANDHNVGLVLASGRTSFDFSKEPEYQKAAERLQKAKTHLENVEQKLAMAGKGKTKIGAPTLRATIA